MAFPPTPAACRRRRGALSTLARAALALPLWPLAALTAQAQPQPQPGPFPSRPITLIVPFAPGGGNDILARLLAPKLQRILGQAVVVENRPGAGGNLGTDAVAKAAPDGHTLVIASSQVTMNPFLGMPLPFRIEDDFAPVGLLASVPLLLVANNDQPFRTLPEFLRYSREHPGRLSYSSPGNGTPQHLAGEVFAKLHGTELLHVPYRGTGPSIADLIGGQVQIAFATFASVIQHVQAGRLRAIGIAGTRRSALMPELPTFAEAGLTGYEAELWYSLLAPARTPRAIVEQLNAALAGALKSPDVQAQVSRQGFETRTSSPDGARRFIADELARWERVIRGNGIKVAP